MLIGTGEFTGGQLTGNIFLFSILVHIHTRIHIYIYIYIMRTWYIFVAFAGILGILVSCHAASILLLDTLALPPISARIRVQLMPDVYQSIEIAMAVPAVGADWQCAGPILFRPGWCATQSSTAPLHVRAFQIGLFPGDRTGPNLTAGFANMRFNMTLSNTSFPLIPLCDAVTNVSQQNPDAPAIFSMYLLNGRAPLNDTNAGPDGIYWLVGYGIMAANYDPASNTDNALLWSLMALDNATANNRPASMLRDRNNYFGHGWTNWTMLNAWEQVYASSLQSQSMHQVRARVEMTGCVFTGIPSPIPISTPLTTTTPVPEFTPSDTPVSTPEVPTPLSPKWIHRPTPEETLVPSPTNSSRDNIVQLRVLSTAWLIVIICISAAVFIPTLLGVLLLVLHLRTRSRLNNNKFSFRESMQGGSVYEIERTGIRMVDLSQSSDPQLKKRHTDRHSSNESSSSSSSSSNNNNNNNNNKRTGSVIVSNTQKKKAKLSKSLRATNVPIAKNSPQSTPLHANEVWITADHMFPINLHDDIKGRRTGRRNMNGEEYSSGSDSPALISEDEDAETNRGTPRTNVQLVDSANSSSNGNNNSDGSSSSSSSSSSSNNSGSGNTRAK
jgi:hypothetical protein